MRTARYGEWPSPLTAHDVASDATRPAFVLLTGDQLWWEESRPAQRGRSTVVRAARAGVVVEVLPETADVRTRVHEYGGRAWLPLGSDTLVHVQWEDQRVYRTGSERVPVPLTPAPTAEAQHRYAEPVLLPGEQEVLWVRETHAAGEIERALVAVPMDGSAADDPERVRVVVSGTRFLAGARPSPDGRRLAWIGWNHPHMPWDSSSLFVADLADGVATDVRRVMGGADESVLQPEWASERTLYALSDRSGWWNLHRVDVVTGASVALHQSEEEFAFPLWHLGTCSYAVLADGRLAVLHGGGETRLDLLDPHSGKLESLDLPFTVWSPTLSACGDTVAGVAASWDKAPAVVRVDLADRRTETVARDGRTLPVRLVSRPELRTVTRPDGLPVHVIVHPPFSPGVRGPEGELPPYVVFVHGGPTTHTTPSLSLRTTYFTSRGIGVLDVNYSGSSGYGRAYRERLRGHWGIADVEDCVTAVNALVAAGEADGARLVIRGGSAGGWTTLCALVGAGTFAAGASYFGVADLTALVTSAHDFESHYVTGLVGPLPDAVELYRERSPLTHADALRVPVLILQGAEDPIVPPEQALLLHDALTRNGVPHAYLEFAGESHGFRRAETLVAALEAELAFYGQVLDFQPPGVPALQLR